MVFLGLPGKAIRRVLYVLVGTAALICLRLAFMAPDPKSYERPLPEPVKFEEDWEMPQPPETLPEFASPDRKRIAVMVYIDKSSINILEFFTMLFSSWRYMLEHQVALLNGTSLDDAYVIDIHVYSHPDVLPIIDQFCKPFPIDAYATPPRTSEDNADYPNLTPIRTLPETCWLFSQPQLLPDHKYWQSNAFQMFERSDIEQITAPYYKILRTDLDAMLTPTFWTFDPSYHDGAIVTGRSTYHYAYPYTVERLKMISKKLGYRHQGVVGMGSSWFAEPKLMITASKLQLKVMKHIFENEFSGVMPEFDVERHSNEWKQMFTAFYASEVALNHLIDNLSEEIKDAGLDVHSYKGGAALTVAQIHCTVATKQEFDKQKFLVRIGEIIASGQIGPDNRAMKTTKAKPEEVLKYSIRRYAAFTAWRGYLMYLLKVVEKHQSALLDLWKP